MRRDLWFAARLAVGDAVLLCSGVAIVLYGLILLIFGFPPEKPTASEVLSALGSALPIFVIIWVVLFVANIGRKGE